MGKWDKPNKPPVIVVPSAVRAIAVVIKDQFNNPIEGVNTILAEGFSGFTNSDGYLVWKNVPVSLKSTTILYSKDGYENHATPITLPELNGDIHLLLPKLNVYIPLNVEIDGKFYKINGIRSYIREVTAFQLLKDYVHNPDAFLNFIEFCCREFKANLFNVLGMFNGGLGEFSPRNSDGYYNCVRRFFKDTYQLGIAIEFTVLADAQNIFSTKEDLINHCIIMRDIISEYPHILTRICNEPYKNLPGFIEIQQLREIFKPLKIYGNGETNQDDLVYEPTGTEITNHPGRDSDWMRKGKNSLELRSKFKIPVRDNECIRPDQGDYNIQGAKEFGATGAMYQIPQCLHSDSLKFGRIPSGDEYKFLKAMSSMWDIIPSEFGDGVYFNPHTTQPCPVKDDSRCLRTYGSQLGNKALAIVIQPRDGYVLEANDGWRIKANHDNMWYELEKI